MDIDPGMPQAMNVETNRLFKTISEMVCVVGLAVSMLALVTSGQNQSPFVTSLFLSTVAVRHLVDAVKVVCPKFVIEADIVERVILCPDMHYLAVMVLFAVAGICPLLYIVLYLFYFAFGGATFICEKVCVGAYEQVGRQVTNVISSPVVQVAPTYIEIALGLQLLVIALFDFRLMTLVALFGYVFLILLFNFANNELHSRIWSTISIRLREVAAQNAETFGPKLENFIDKVTEWGTEAAKLYPQKELKVHLQ